MKHNKRCISCRSNWERFRVQLSIVILVLKLALIVYQFALSKG